MNIIFEVLEQPDVGLYRRAICNLFVAQVGDFKKHEIHLYAMECVDLLLVLRRTTILCSAGEDVVKDLEARAAFTIAEIYQRCLEVDEDTNSNPARDLLARVKETKPEEDVSSPAPFEDVDSSNFEQVCETVTISTDWLTNVLTWQKATETHNSQTPFKIFGMFSRPDDSEYEGQNLQAMREVILADVAVPVRTKMKKAADQGTSMSIAYMTPSSSFAEPEEAADEGTSWPTAYMTPNSSSTEPEDVE